MSDTAHDSPRHELRDPPPTPGEVQAAQEETRDILEQSEMAAGRLEHDHVGRIAVRAARRESRRFGLWGVLFAALISLAVSLVAVSVAARASTTAEQATQSAQSAQHTIDDALAKLKEANDQLVARGQAPVTTSPTPDPAEAIQAAVLAKVLAQLPAPPVTPTAEQVASVLQPTVVAQVAGPNRDTLAALVADYFAPSGPATAAIQAAVDDFLIRHPVQPGPQGIQGIEGKQGIPGESPQCLSEPAQCRGQDGTNGANGADSMVPGPPPGSWSWPDPNPLFPVIHTCTRSGGTDDSPNYTCT